MLTAYPLCWPQGWKRTKSGFHRNATFSKKESVDYMVGTERKSRGVSKWLTVSDAVSRVMTTLEKMGISPNDVIISTNVRTRLDGMPRSGEKEPDDKGAAVYWRKGATGAMRCMAIDQYTLVADNIAAVAATLEAMRAIERHGGAEILDRAFTGFAALPETTSKPWREVLGLAGDRISKAIINDQYRSLARVRHPDAGGTEEKMSELNVARDQALSEVGE